MWILSIFQFHQNPNTTDSMTNKFLAPQWLKIFALEFDSIGGCVGFSSLHEKPDFRHCNHLQTSLVPTVSGCLKPVKSAFVCTINCQEWITGSKSLATCSLLLNHTHYALLYSLKELPLQLTIRLHLLHHFTLDSFNYLPRATLLFTTVRNNPYRRSQLFTHTFSE